MLTPDRRRRFGIGPVVAVSALALVSFFNVAFFVNTARSYPPLQGNIGFLLSLAVLLCALSTLLLALACNRYTVKPLLMLLFPAAATAAYFMDSYNVIIDSQMLGNALQTNLAEASDLFSARLLLYIVFLGLLPAAVIYRLPLVTAPIWEGLRSTARVTLLSVTAMGLAIAPFSAQYASFFREHKVLRYYANPVSPLYAVGAHFSKRHAVDPDLPRTVLGSDATIAANDRERELVIMVVGETARADRFSLNGYARKTNPELEKFESLVSFSAMQSCATSTAVSLPCMFALPDGESVDVDAFHRSENLLDVLKHAGVTVLWRDNNSDSKGVARDIAFEDFRGPDRNPDCDTECRDPGMLAGLDRFVDGVKAGDILIVLHQMGNHGPAYARRYPPAFEVFRPVCDSNQLEQCSLEEINNSYDNAIRYTDYFLGKTIEFLRSYDTRFETALFYISDHGESLGERGLYLHGLPNLVAPAEQREVASVMWFGDNFKADRGKVSAHSADRLTHANVFHTVLGMFEVHTGIYRKELDILKGARGQPGPDGIL